MRTKLEGMFRATVVLVSELASVQGMAQQMRGEVSNVMVATGTMKC